MQHMLLLGAHFSSLVVERKTSTLARPYYTISNRNRSEAVLTDREHSIGNVSPKQVKTLLPWDTR